MSGTVRCCLYSPAASTVRCKHSQNRQMWSWRKRGAKFGTAFKVSQHRAETTADKERNFVLYTWLRASAILVGHRNDYTAYHNRYWQIELSPKMVR